jgi:hypothetical protein
MSPEDTATLRQALLRKNHERRTNRMDADMRFRYLNKKYSRPVVDEEVSKMKASGALPVGDR